MCHFTSKCFNAGTFSQLCVSPLERMNEWMNTDNNKRCGPMGNMRKHWSSLALLKSVQIKCHKPSANTHFEPLAQNICAAMRYTYTWHSWPEDTDSKHTREIKSTQGEIQQHHFPKKLLHVKPNLSTQQHFRWLRGCGRFSGWSK